MQKLKEIIRLLENDKEYKAFFRNALEKFGVSSPADFDSDKKKKEFFNYIELNYTKEKNEGVLKEQNFEKAIQKEYSNAKDALVKLIKASREWREASSFAHDCESILKQLRNAYVKVISK